MITYDRLHELLTYNVDTGIFTWRVNRGPAKAGSVAGCKNSDGYIVIRLDYELYYAHRLAWLYQYGYMPEPLIDHEYRMCDDNRINELRETSKQCNARNTGNFKHNTSGVKGVSVHEGKWRARVRTTVGQKCLGVYADFEEAVFARYAAEQCLGWKNCDSNSPARQWLLRHGYLKG